MFSVLFCTLDTVDTGVIPGLSVGSFGAGEGR